MLLVETLELATGRYAETGAAEVFALVGEPDRRLTSLCACGEDRFGSRVGLADDDGYAGFDDAGFLSGYLRERRAEELGMVETDIGDDGEDGREDIGAVESSAESDFDDGYVNLLSDKIVEGECGHRLEERGLELVELGAIGRDESGYLGFGDRLSVHTDTFAEGDKVG